MPFAAPRKVWRRVLRAYHLVCARDDAAARGLTVPSGVWICQLCEQAWLELSSLRAHVLAEHTTP